MKKSVINQLFHGVRGNSQLMTMTAEGHRLISVVADIYDELLKELTPKQKELQNKFVEARELQFYEEADNHYNEGFKLGLLIGIECMEE